MNCAVRRPASDHATPVTTECVRRRADQHLPGALESAGLRKPRSPGLRRVGCTTMADRWLCGHQLCPGQRHWLHQSCGVSRNWVVTADKESTENEMPALQESPLGARSGPVNSSWKDTTANCPDSLFEGAGHQHAGNPPTAPDFWYSPKTARSIVEFHNCRVVLMAIGIAGSGFRWSWNGVEFPRSGRFSGVAFLSYAFSRAICSRSAPGQCWSESDVLPRFESHSRRQPSISSRLPLIVSRLRILPVRSRICLRIRRGVVYSGKPRRRFDLAGDRFDRVGTSDWINGVRHSGFCAMISCVRNAIRAASS